MATYLTSRPLEPSKGLGDTMFQGRDGFWHIGYIESGPDYLGRYCIRTVCGLYTVVAEKVLSVAQQSPCIPKETL